MARRVIFSATASENIVDIAEWIGAESPVAASKVAEEVISKAESLDEMAERGRRLKDVDGIETRQILAFNYRIIYQIYQSEVVIMTIVHTSQDFGMEKT
jgi:plasmid stabilization system protein ParE